MLHVYNNCVIIITEVLQLLLYLDYSQQSSGADTAQYKAVLSSLEDIITAIKATPEVKETLSIKFKMKEWIKPTVACSEAELAECALEKVRQDPEQFPVLVKMFHDTVGMNVIAKKLEQSN